MIEITGDLLDNVVFIGKILLHGSAVCIFIMYLIAVFVVHMNIDCFFFRMVQPRRVLVVVGYPTNECNFFGPFIVRISADKGCQIYLLSLCQNSQEDIGAMWRCCTSLGIPASHVTLFKSDHLPKDTINRWPEEDSSKVILYQVECLDIDLVVTFDCKGIDGNMCHRSVFYAVATLFARGMLPHSCRVFVLETVSPVRSRLGILDVPLSLSAESFCFVASNDQRKRIMKAIRQHSKLSKIYGPYFRYSGVSTMRELDILDMVLEPACQVFE